MATRSDFREGKYQGLEEVTMVEPVPAGVRRTVTKLTQYNPDSSSLTPTIRRRDTTLAAAGLEYLRIVPDVALSSMDWFDHGGDTGVVRILSEGQTIEGVLDKEPTTPDDQPEFFVAFLDEDVV